MNETIIAGPVAFIPDAGAAVYFSSSSQSAGVYKSTGSGTSVAVKTIQKELDVAIWGEDNRFPQNITKQLSFCGVAESALDWKARALLGQGIVPGRVVDYLDEGKTEVFEPLKPGSEEGKEIYKFLRSSAFNRFMIEFSKDWTKFANCFPEVIFSYDAKTITGFVHQETCDCRFKQMGPDGIIDTVYISKIWGLAKDQFNLFDPKKNIVGLVENKTNPTKDDLAKKLVAQVDAIDMYNALDSAIAIGKKLAKNKKVKEFKSAILPVNYPSSNKPYYQVPYWDGARLSGWLEIAAKVPALYKQLFNRATKIRYHIEVPETYFEEKYGAENWIGFTEGEKADKKKDLLNDFKKFLTTEENAYTTFVSFFQVDNINKKEYGQIKINVVKDENSIDKELLLSSAAVIETLMAMQIHPTLYSSGMAGSAYKGGGSGSDIREAWLIYTSLLSAERKMILEPLNLMRDYNRVVGGQKVWAEDLEFRIRDTVLTTLNTGKGTAKTLS